VFATFAAQAARPSRSGATTARPHKARVRSRGFPPPIANVGARCSFHPLQRRLPCRRRRCRCELLPVQKRPKLLQRRVLLGVRVNPALPLFSHTSQVTLSLVIRHTSHATRHSSHVTRHTSHVARHTSHVTILQDGIERRAAVHQSIVAPPTLSAPPPPSLTSTPSRSDADVILQNVTDDFVRL
jgi:hypothetical protein